MGLSSPIKTPIRAKLRLSKSCFTRMTWEAKKLCKMMIILVKGSCFLMEAHPTSTAEKATEPTIHLKCKANLLRWHRIITTRTTKQWNCTWHTYFSKINEQLWLISSLSQTTRPRTDWYKCTRIWSPSWWRRIRKRWKICINSWSFRGTETINQKTQSRTLIKLVANWVNCSETSKWPWIWSSN